MSDNALVIPTEQEEIQLQIDESRAALTDKIERLENKVSETVQAATASVAEATASVMETVNNATASVSETVGSVNAAVQGTVENVKNSVSETVASVKDTFDLPEQVRKYPWQMLAGAVAMGYVSARYLQPAARSTMASNQGPDRNGDSPSIPSEQFPSDASVSFKRPDSLSEPRDVHAAAQSNEKHRETPAAATRTWMDQLGETFGGEIAKLRGMAIGASLGLVRDMISDSAPESLRPQIAEVVDGFTQKLGGQHFPSPVLSAASSPPNWSSETAHGLAVQRDFKNVPR